MNELACPHCGSVRAIGHVTCAFCRNPYSAEAARGAIACPHCRTLSTSDQAKCVGCGAWIVVQCVFCGGLSPYTMAGCVKCGEAFAGAAERKAQRDAAAAAGDDDELEDGWESDWAWCSKCQALVYDDETPGPCARGGGHDTDDSESYWLAVDADDYEGHGGFRWCEKCQCLYRGGPHAGVCAATKGPHDGAESDEYTVAHDGSDDDDYEGWFVCNRCSVLFWGEEKGACAAGGTHDRKGSANYEVWHEDDEE
jgi:hypothetical protein